MVKEYETRHTLLSARFLGPLGSGGKEFSRKGARVNNESRRKLPNWYGSGVLILLDFYKIGDLVHDNKKEKADRPGGGAEGSTKNGEERKSSTSSMLVKATSFLAAKKVASSLRSFTVKCAGIVSNCGI